MTNSEANSRSSRSLFPISDISRNSSFTYTYPCLPSEISDGIQDLEGILPLVSDSPVRSTMLWWAAGARGFLSILSFACVFLKSTKPSKGGSWTSKSPFAPFPALALRATLCPFIHLYEYPSDISIYYHVISRPRMMLATRFEGTTIGSTKAAPSLSKLFSLLIE